ncbi:MAG TPA: hypothetical protein VI299_02100, partial [Polyangiales bacterium]
AIFGRNPELAQPLAECTRVTRDDLARAARRVIRRENAYAVCVGKVKKAVEKQAFKVMAAFR